jgi:hypothetical protein
MDLALYWLLLPLLYLAVFAGLGFLLRWAAGGLSAPLIIPVGIAVAITVTSFVTYFGATASAAGPLLVLGALAGGVLAVRAGRPSREDWREGAPWMLAGVVAFLAFGASVFLSGRPTFTGYTQIVDIAHQFDLAHYVARHGREIPAVIDSSYLTQVAKNLDVGYPTALQAVLGSLTRAFGLELAWGYQPLLAVLTAAIVPASYALLTPIVASRGLRAVGAFVASQGSILLSYAQMGGIKELAVALFVLVGAATVVRAATGDRGPGWREALPFVVAAAAMLAVLSMTALAWLGLLALCGLVAAWRAVGLRPTLVRCAVVGALLVGFALPSIAAATNSLRAVSVVRSDEELGNLAEPVGWVSASGIWLTADHRYPLAGREETLTMVLGALAFGLAAVGIVAAIQRRDAALIALGVSGVGGLVFIVAVMGPWVQLKAFAISAPITLTLAMAGLGVARGIPRAGRFVAVAGTVVLLGATLAADAQRYREAMLAPYDRLRELQRFGDDYAGAKGTFLPDFEEHGEYLMRDARAVSPVNPPLDVGIELTEAAAQARPGLQFTRDLDEFDLPWLSKFEMLVTRRAPGISRAPGNYKMVEQGEYYTVWRRTSPTPAPVHVPLSSAPTVADRNVCRASLRRHRSAPRVSVAPGARAVSAQLNPETISPNLSLVPDGTAANVSGPGRVQGSLSVPRGGRYDLYLLTTARRPVRVELDGRSLGEFSANGYEPRPVLIGTPRLRAGRHSVRLTRPGGSLSPGDVDPAGSALGPLWAVPAGALHPAVVTASGPEARCGSRIDWIEVRR